VELGFVNNISPNTIHRVLKKTTAAIFAEILSSSSFFRRKDPVGRWENEDRWQSSI